MAGEISVTAAISILKEAINPSAFGESLPEPSTFDMAGLVVSRGILTVLTTETTIPMGSVTLPHWCWFYNSSESGSFLRIKNAASGTSIMKLYPGEGHPIAWDPANTAPVAIADTASQQLTFLICQY